MFRALTVAVTTFAVTTAGLTLMSAAEAADVNCPAASGTLSGSGTLGAPYLIQSQGDLQFMRDGSPDLTKFYQQTTDIDMQIGGSNCIWDEGIGTGQSGVPVFSGVYDGGNFEISGVDVSSSIKYTGLFGTATGTIKNLGFTGDVTGTSTSTNVGVGGLVGYLDGGTVQNSYATGDVTSAYTDQNGSGTGGLVGRTSSGTISITDSYASGAVTAWMGGVGGLVGRLASNSGTISQSYSTGSVETTGTFAGDGSAGGLIGRQTGTSTVVRSFSTGDVTGTSTSEHLASLIGAAGNISVTDSFATGGIFGGDEQIGGVVGDFTLGTFTRVYTATLTGINNATMRDASLGGLAGNAGQNDRFFSSLWNSDTAAPITDSFGLGSSADIPGKTTAQMTDIATYTDPTGLDWNNGGATTIAEGYDATYTWGICSAVNSGYPFLTALYSSDPCTSPSPTPSSSGSSAPPMTFRYYLPSGAECTAISPQVVVNRTRVTLPGADASCHTPGATISGWKIAGQDWAFTPGYSVFVVASQRFTAILNEPTASIVLDANVKALDPCMASVDGVETNLAVDNRTRTLHLDRPDMDEYGPGERPSLATYPAPTTAPCAPPGYELLSWNTRGDGTGTTVDIGSPFDPAINDDDPNSDRNTVRFYAVWGERSQLVEVSRSVFFEDTSADFTTTGRDRLNSLANAIPTDATNVRVYVSGVSVSLESISANTELGQTRATALSEALKSLGVPGDYTSQVAESQIRAWMQDQPVDPPTVPGDPKVSAAGKPLSTVTITYEVR